MNPHHSNEEPETGIRSVLVRPTPSAAWAVPIQFSRTRREQTPSPSRYLILLRQHQSLGAATRGK